jgi:hypothetical protein
MNCYFEMPFGRGAHITLTNDGAERVPNLYFHVDYERYPDENLVKNKGRFHAQWKRQVTKAIPESETSGRNVDGKNNYVLMDAEGKGQYVGTILNIFGLSTGWWGEGDDFFFIDEKNGRPAINGTGLEDYFNNAWMFQSEFSYPYIGYSNKGNRDWTGAHTMYRFHVADPIRFSRSLRATMEHGHANDRSDEYTSVAFWYQTEPHKQLFPLPGMKGRIPTSFWKVERMEKNLPN